MTKTTRRTTNTCVMPLGVRARQGLHLGIVALATALAAACTPAGRIAEPHPRPEERAAHDERLVRALTVQPGSLGGVDLASLRARLAASSYAYFRFVDAEFTAVVCAEYREELAREPIVNLHGDAHVEQYAVAADGRGLADFDSATRGEPLVDWIRFATSLRIAASSRRLGDATPAIEAFFRGYRAGLADPDLVAPEPRVAQQLRQRFVTPSVWLARMDSFIVPGSRAVDVKAVGQRAASAVESLHPKLGDGFFEVKHAGAIQMGIGSARASKFLVRIEGASPSDGDDVMLEAKQVVEAPAAHCRARSATLEDAERIIAGLQRLSPVPPPFLGTFQYAGASFYVHSWRENYTELSHDDLRTMNDMIEIAFDVGVQLGHGHPKDLDDGRAPPLRRRLADLARRLEPMVAAESRRLEALVERAWRRGPGSLPQGDASTQGEAPDVRPAP